MLNLVKNALSGLVLFGVLVLAFQACKKKVKNDSLQQIKKTSAMPIFAEKTKAYSWTEMMGGYASEHAGGILFRSKGGKIYSTAWWVKGPYSPEWPKVEGMGSIEGQVVTVVYRNATGSPESDFYHAVVSFEFSDDWESFKCHFVQQDSPDDKTLGEGRANGSLIEGFTDSKSLANLNSFNRWYQHVIAIKEKNGMCPVVLDRNGKADFFLHHKDKTYVFCCPSCLKEFRRSPHKYIQE